MRFPLAGREAIIDGCVRKGNTDASEWRWFTVRREPIHQTYRCGRTNPAPFVGVDVTSTGAQGRFADRLGTEGLGKRLAPSAAPRIGEFDALQRACGVHTTLRYSSVLNPFRIVPDVPFRGLRRDFFCDAKVHVLYRCTKTYPSSERPLNALASVISSAYSMSAPIGKPRARRVVFRLD